MHVAAFSHGKKQKRPQREKVLCCFRGDVFWDKEAYVCQRVPIKIIWPRRWVTTQENGNVECTCVGTYLACHTYMTRTFLSQKNSHPKRSSIIFFTFSVSIRQISSRYANSGGRPYAMNKLSKWLPFSSLLEKFGLMAENNKLKLKNFGAMNVSTDLSAAFRYTIILHIVHNPDIVPRKSRPFLFLLDTLRITKHILTIEPR